VWHHSPARWIVHSAASFFGTLIVCSAVQAELLTLRVQHVAHGAPYRLGDLDYRTEAGERYSVTRASYLLSGFALRDVRGNWHELEEAVAWLDAGKNRTEAALGEVPAGSYTQLRFSLGLDAETNALDPARIPAGHPLDPNLNGLHWSWQGGFIFLAFEGFWKASNEGPVSGFAYHLGRDENRIQIVLDGNVEVISGTPALVRIGFNLGGILSGARPVSLAGDGTSTHSQPGDSLVVALRANLPGAFSWQGAERSTGGPSATPKPITTALQGLGPWNAAFPPPAQSQESKPELIALGRRLFHEGGLSRDGSVSCASCHPQITAFADPRRFSLGVDGKIGARHGMPLFNLAWKREFFWDGRASSLREQALVPIQDPLEMEESLDNVVAKLERAGYGPSFASAFATNEITPERIGLALEGFLLTLTSHDSKFDRAMRGEGRLTEQEERGFRLFMTERDQRLGIQGADCFHCHGGALFTDHQFRNNGLAIAESDLGRYRITGSGLDRGTFATPSLRNIALTAPYMHDGRFTTLEDVLDHYSEGVQRTDTLDPNLAKHPDGGLHLSPGEKADVIAFLRTLSDPQFDPGR
jgi:cytochrome c peroxidase